MKVGFHLRNNLINVLGYLINRPDGPKDELYHYLVEIETGIRLGTIDVFSLIPVVSSLHSKDIITQLKAILGKLAAEDRYEMCNVRCSAEETSARIQDHGNLVAHFNPQLLMNGILNPKDGMTVERLQEVAKRIKRLTFKKETNDGQEEVEVMQVFNSPTISEIFREARRKMVPLNQQFFGYLLPFYGWSVNDVTLQYVVLHLAYKLTSRRRGDLYSCKVRN